MKRGSTARAEAEGSYLGSVSDLMSALIFIFIIALVTFALALKEQEVRFTGIEQERRDLLEDLKEDLERAGIPVTIVPEQGVLRLGERLLFALGRADLDEQGRRTVERLATALGYVLPCYTVAPESVTRRDCGSRGRAGRVDALFIEGHTDDLPFAGFGQFKDNWDLSTARAKTIFAGLLEASNGELDQLRNQDAQPVLGVSAYAERRGVAPNDSDEHRALNRRIDLRFVMVPPKELVAPAAETKREVEK